MNEVELPSSVVLQDIKKELYTEEELEKMKTLAGSLKHYLIKGHKNIRRLD